MAALVAIMITIAINKGRIYQETVQLLLKAKILDQASTREDRRLVFSSPSGDYRFLVVRSADVPIYVERGAADIGVTGKDSIMEYGASILKDFGLSDEDRKFIFDSIEKGEES